MVLLKRRSTGRKRRISVWTANFWTLMVKHLARLLSSTIMDYGRKLLQGTKRVRHTQVDIESCFCICRWIRSKFIESILNLDSIYSKEFRVIQAQSLQLSALNTAPPKPRNTQANCQFLQQYVQPSVIFMLSRATMPDPRWWRWCHYVQENPDQSW